MFKPRVYVSRQIFSEALDLIEKVAEMELWPEDEPPSSEQLKEALANVDGAIINVMDRIDGPVLDAAPKLKVLSQVAVGLPISIAIVSGPTPPGTGVIYFTLSITSP